VHRGAALGDIDNDGRVDAVTTALDGPLELWRNVTPAAGHWLSVRLQGRASNRDGMDAAVTLVTEAGRQYDHVSTAGGYGAASDPRVHFGLGGERVVRELSIRWPSGRTQTLANVDADQVLTVREAE